MASPRPVGRRIGGWLLAGFGPAVLAAAKHAPLAGADDAVVVQALADLLAHYRELAGADEGRRAEASGIVERLIEKLPGRPVLAEFRKSLPR